MTNPKPQPTPFTNPLQRQRELPRNLFSFSSARARRELGLNKPRLVPMTHGTNAEHDSNSSASASDSSADEYQAQLDLFAQRNLFGPEFDVLDELSYNADKFKALGPDKQQITCYNVPSIVSYNIDRIVKKLNNAHGKNIVLACLVSYGVAQLYKNPHVKELTELRDKILDDHPSNSGRDVIEFYDFFRSFKIDIPDDSAGLSRERTNVIIPEWLAQSLGGLATRLGAPVFSLLIICAMYTLISQPIVIDAHQKQLSQAIDTFLRRVEFRKRIATVLVEML